MAVMPSMSWKGIGIRPRAAGACGGTVEGYRWEAYLAREPVSYGLNPQTLYKGEGRIVRLELLAPVAGRVWRRVAVYNRGWVFGRKAYLPVLARLVRELDG